MENGCDGRQDACGPSTGVSTSSWRTWWRRCASGKGVGLAAPQVGLNQRIFVIEFPEDEERPEETMRRYELINPELVKAKGSEIAHEACLSLPGLAAEVDRATYVLVKAQDRHGKTLRIKAYDWLARIFQHEIDHLGGVLMIDVAEQVYKVVEVEEGEPELLLPISELFGQGGIVWPVLRDIKAHSICCGPFAARKHATDGAALPPISRDYLT